MKKKNLIMAFIACMFMVCLIFAGCSSKTNTSSVKEETTTANTNKDKAEESKSDLASYVKGLKDLTVEVGSKNVDFLNGVTYDKKVVKEVKADASKVDLAKEGKYDLVYSIVPVDTKVSKTTVTKTVTVKVVSETVAQAEADKGNQVVTSDNVIKKDSDGNTPAPAKEEETSSASSKSDSTSASSGSDKGNSNSANNSGSSEPANSNSSTPAVTETAKPSTPATTEPAKPAEPSTPAPTEPAKPAEPEKHLVHHDEVGHWETVTVSDAYDEPVYEYHTFCGTCGQDFGCGASAVEAAGYHIIDNMVDGEYTCQNYYSKTVQVGSTHHDAVTEQQWVVDQAAYDSWEY